MNLLNSSIIIFTDKYPYGSGEIFLHDELEFLAHSFDKILIFPIEKGNSEKIRKIPDHIKIAYPVFTSIKNKKELLFKGMFNTSTIYPFFRDLLKQGVLRSHFSFYNWVVHLLMIRAVLHVIKKKKWADQFNQYDILYFYWGLRWSQIIPFLPFNIKSKIIVRFHGSDLYENLNRNYIPLREEQLQRINLAVFVSEMGKNYLINSYPFMEPNSIVSRLGTTDFGLNPFQTGQRIHIVTCSNVVRVKRLELIVQCFSHIDIEIKWTHIGFGEKMKELRESVKCLPGNVHVELTGQMEHEDIMSFYKNQCIHLFLNVSSSEGVPVSVMEALSFGIPVIATDVGGTSEIVNDKVGFLVNVNISPFELSLRIMELLNSKKYLDFRKYAREQWEQLCRKDIIYPKFINTFKNMDIKS